MPEQKVKSTIVVGVDGSVDCKRALEWALDEAEHHGMTLLLVNSVDLEGGLPGSYFELGYEASSNFVVE